MSIVNRNSAVPLHGLRSLILGHNLTGIVSQCATFAVQASKRVAKIATHNLRSFLGSTP